MGPAYLRRLGVAVAVTALLATLAACGGEDSKEPKAAESAKATKSSGSTGSAEGGSLTSGQPTPKNMPKIKGASMVPIPSEGPTQAIGFPVPPWIKNLKSPGALDESWQFDIPTDDPDRVIEFYKKILPRGGYKIRTDIDEEIGIETVHWDIVFDGPCHGTIVKDPEAKTVFVDVRAVQQVPADVQ